MTEGTEKLPINLKRLAELITKNQPPEKTDPILTDLAGELDLIGAQIGRDAVVIGPGGPAPDPEVVARSLTDALKVYVEPGGSSGNGMEVCPVPGCGRLRTKAKQP